MIIEIPQTFLNSLPAYLFIGFSIFWFLGAIIISIKDRIYSIGILFSILGIIFLICGLIGLGIIEIKIT